ASAETFLDRARGSLVGTPIAGALNADATIGGTIAAPVVDAVIAAPNISAGSVTGAAFNAQARYTTSQVTVKNLDAAWQQTRVHASGDVGLTGAQPLALQARIEETPIDSLLAAAGKSDLQTTGIVSMQADIHGTVKQPAGTANVALRDLKMSDADY